MPDFVLFIASIEVSSINNGMVWDEGLADRGGRHFQVVIRAE
jgi:hypothetical protein